MFEGLKGMRTVKVLVREAFLPIYINHWVNNETVARILLKDVGTFHE